jgi:hypothetical protein
MLTVNTAVYEPYTDTLTYIAPELDPGFGRAAKLGALGFAREADSSRYQGRWSPESWALLTQLAGVIGDAQEARLEGLTWERRVTRWEDPDYWHGRAQRLAAHADPEGSVRVAKLAMDAESLEAVATQALAGWQTWHARVPPKAEETSARLRTVVDAHLEGEGALRAAFDAGEVSPMGVIAAKCHALEQLYRWAKQCALHTRLRLAYFETMAHPGPAPDPTPARLLAFAAPGPEEYVCLIGFPEDTALPGEGRRINPVRHLGDVDVRGTAEPRRCTMLCLLPRPASAAQDILTAVRWLQNGHTLVTVCPREAFETAQTPPAWETLRRLRTYLPFTVVALDATRILLKIVAA